MDENWGYPHFKKPQFLSMLLSLRWNPTFAQPSHTHVDCHGGTNLMLALWWSFWSFLVISLILGGLFMPCLSWLAQDVWRCLKSQAQLILGNNIRRHPAGFTLQAPGERLQSSLQGRAFVDPKRLGNPLPCLDKISRTKTHIHPHTNIFAHKLI